MKRVLITGGAKRIGAILAQRFAQEGFAVIIHFNSSRNEAEELLTQLSGTGHKIIGADFMDSNQVDNLFNELNEPIDVLINNASVYDKFNGVLTENSDYFQQVFQVNSFAPISLMQQFAKQNLDNGIIVNILDMEVLRQAPNGGAYSWSRRVLKDATIEYAKALAPKIRVCGIAPGPVLPPEWAPESRMEKVLKSVPLGQAVDLDDLVNSVFFIINNKSITGEVIAIDGGQHIS